MALIYIQTKETKSEKGNFVGITRPIFSKKVAARVQQLTGINLPQVQLQA